MKLNFINKKFAYASIIGGLIIIFSSMLTSFLSFQLTLYQTANLSVEDFLQFRGTLLAQLLFGFLRFISLAAIIFSGFIVAWKMREKGIVYAVSFGILWYIVSFATSIAIIYFSLEYASASSDELTKELIRSRFADISSLGILLGLIKISALTGLGGLIFNFLKKRNYFKLLNNFLLGW